MTINKNSVEQINVALLDLDKKIKSAISNGTSASDFKNLEASVDSIKRTLDEAKTGLEPGKTYNINISGNAATADKATTATIAEKASKLVNDLIVNGKTYNGSTAVDAGVQTVENGGTGVTTQAEINKAFIANLDVGESDVTDGTEFVSSWASDNGFNETEGAVNTPYKRKFSKVWNYIKDKISSVLGLTATAYSNVQIGGAGVTGSKLTIQGNAVGSNSYTDANPKLEFKNDDGRQNISLTFTDADAVQAPSSLTLNGNQGNEYFIAPNIKVTGNFYGNLSGKADTATTADYAKNMHYQNLDLSALDKTKFYPLVCLSYQNFAEVAICSESGMGSMEYNQNRIHFDISTQGWSDLSPTLNIREYACYENNEITIGCIGRGMHNGAWAIWLRGGLHYICFSRNSDLSLHTSNYTFYDETYTVGTNYYGGTNTNVQVWFTPQSTIIEGAYSSRPITAPNITSLEQRVAALESKM